MLGPVRSRFQNLLEVTRDLAALIASGMRSRAQLAAETCSCAAVGVVPGTAGEAAPGRRRHADHPRRFVVVRRLAAATDRREARNPHPMASKGIPVMVAL